jgi:CBS domain containing-hemolysin-like protein
VDQVRLGVALEAAVLRVGAGVLIGRAVVAALAPLEPVTVAPTAVALVAAAVALITAAVPVVAPAVPLVGPSSVGLRVAGGCAHLLHQLQDERADF